MKTIELNRNYNIAIDNQYSVYAAKKDEHTHQTMLEDEYELNFFFGTPMSNYGITGDFMLGIEDFANIARAVCKLTDVGFPIDTAVKRKYLSGCAYDKKAKHFESDRPRHREGLYTLTVEKERNSVLSRACYANLFKLTWSYKTVFGNEDKFIIVLRETDFIELGKKACKMLAEKINETKRQEAMLDALMKMHEDND